MAAAVRANPGEPVFLDVRTEREVRTGHLPGALRIPLDELPERLDEIAQATAGDWSYPIQIYCRRGKRAQQALEYLQELGFTNVTNLGGIETSLPSVMRPEALSGGRR